MRRAIVTALVALSLTASPLLVAQASETPQEWVARADTLFRAERYLESVAAYQRGMQLRAPNAHESAWQIARAYARLGNAKQASRWLMHARQLGFSDERAITEEPGLMKLLEAQRSTRGRTCTRTTTALVLSQPVCHAGRSGHQRG